MKRPIVISIEGVISVGKSTFIEHTLVPVLTEKGFRVKVIKEPVDEWTTILPLFYENPEKWGYTFQTQVFCDRINESCKMWDESTDIFISERSPLSDKIFMSVLHEQKFINDVEMECYQKWCDLWVKLLPFKYDLFVYLAPSMEDTMNRLKKRGRPGEEGITETYQRLLQKYHDFTFQEGGDLPVIKVIENTNYVTDTIMSLMK